MITPEKQLCRLLEKVVEDRCSEDHRQQLNELIRQHPELAQTYCDFMAVHGALHWDAGSTDRASVPPGVKPSPNRLQRSAMRKVATVAGFVTALGLLFAAAMTWWPAEQDTPVVVENDPAESEDNSSTSPKDPESDANVIVVDNEPVEPLKPLDTQIVASDKPKPTPDEIDIDVTPPEPKSYFAASFTDADVTAKIDELLKQSWADHEITPAERADDTQWLRRAYLVYAGRIPGRQELQDFESQPEARRRVALIERLSQSDETPEYLADLWTQLMIGRTNRPGVNRGGLQRYLVRQFTQDAPWIDTVTDLITARGRNDRNGATNFLLAHLNNQATPATAVTARLFLGQQISCVQCHDHPFAKGVRQQDYWALNAFFKDTRKVSISIADAGDRPMRDLPWKLEDRPIGDRPAGDRMTYFENRSGLSIGVLPQYDGTTMDHRSTENRRATLAKLLATDSQKSVARSMVNRMWAHFFGYAFTNPIDDMGPHVPVSHPELLDALTEAFVKSNYSLKRLMKWIALSDAWQRSSLAASDEEMDRPEVGDAPLFARVYPRRMSPEQVYESIRVAIQSVGSLPVTSRQDHADHRRDWVRQFTKSYDTDENDESMDFEGTIAQAMVMMNGPEVSEAIQEASLSLLGNQKGATTKALNALTESVLCREPTELERKAFRRHVQQMNRRNPQAGSVVAVEDMLWAYLNSTEFVTVH